MKIKVIADAWIKTLHHTEQEQIEAQKKLDICNGCEHKSTGLMDFSICNLCMCPISQGSTPIGKLYSTDTCPIKKW